MNGWGFAARSQLAPVHADPPSAATRLGGQMPVAGRAETSSGFPRLGPSVSGFLDTQAVTRQDVPKAPAFQPIGKLPKPGPAEDHRITTTTRQISDRVPSRRLPQADQGPDAAQLVDLVFAAAAWLDGP
jgi:hypothetical protein